MPVEGVLNPGNCTRSGGCWLLLGERSESLKRGGSIRLMPVEGVLSPSNCVLNPSNCVLSPSNCAEALDKRADQLV